MMRLLLLTEPQAGRAFFLPSESCTVGRADDNGIQLEDLTVSLCHALLERTEAGWLLEDLGSENGTFLGGVRIRRAVLSPGDVVVLGAAELRYEEAPPTLFPGGILGFGWWRDVAAQMGAFFRRMFRWR